MKHDPQSMPDDRADAEAAILEHVKGDGYEPLPLRDLLDAMRVPRRAKPLYRRAASSLLESGRIARVRGGRLGASEERLARGRIRVHPKGFGFVRPEEPGPDVFVPPRRLSGARHGDSVEVRVTATDRDGRLEGEVVAVLERRGRHVLGVFRARDRGGLVEPFDPEAPGPIAVPGAFRMGAAEGDAVEVLVLRPGGRDERPEGKVVDVLGRLGRAGVDTAVVIRRHELRTRFADEASEQARRLPGAVPAEEAAVRERFDAPVTIDGETARDFDDAVAVAEVPSGFRLFVHIADVAHFVEPGSPLDLEARARGTSVYFPDRVLPMFPEKLSNDLCSLRPDEPRLVQSAILDFDRQGEPRGVRFADGVIRSAARLTYRQVASALEGIPPEPPVPRRILAMLRSADRLREILERRRVSRGSIDFDLPEPRILLDVEGVMTGIAVEPRNRAHRMIEEFMLAANEAVAGHLERAGSPCLYRIHEQPDPVKVEALAEFAAALGHRLVADPEKVRPEDVRRLVEAAEGRPEHAVLSQVALRSLKQARYSAENAGHFGLASPVYAHFTSPIRRYPDLVLHRLLRAQRRGDRKGIARAGEGLEEVAALCSKLEREAEAAERELLEWKKISFMKGREGDSFDGIVTGVARFGLFVQLRETLAEGLLRIERLGADRFEFLDRRMEIRGERTGRAIRLGDAVRVVVDRVDPVLRRLDLSLDPSWVPAAPVRSQGAAARGARRRGRARGGRR